MNVSLKRKEVAALLVAIDSYEYAVDATDESERSEDVRAILANLESVVQKLGKGGYYGD